MKYIVFPTVEQCQSRCDELTTEYKKLFPEDKIDVYARPKGGAHGFYVGIVPGCESLFTKDELDSAVDYERLPEPEQFEFEV